MSQRCQIRTSRPVLSVVVIKAEREGDNADAHRYPVARKIQLGMLNKEFFRCRQSVRLVRRVKGVLPIPECVFDEQAKSCSIDKAIAEIDRRNAHSALDPIEGAVWRVERQAKDGTWSVDFLAKYVRPGKVDGKYLPELSGAEAVWNWHPGK